MCGIAGFTGSPDREVLRRMTDAVIHRGPDDSGLLSEPSISLSMRRLSIIDLKTGQQPVSNEDETVWVVFNGEIYNHLELRKELEAQGHRFKTQGSDTEVLVHLYEEHGPNYLSKLVGMFGIALWDAKKQELHLARDHSGIKPLYFARAGREIVFGSEIKSILAHPKVAKNPNWKAIHHYFSLKNVPAPMSAFDGIEQLLPGERAVFSNGKLYRERWWKLEFSENDAITEAEAIAEIRRILSESVRLQMRSDVPIGAYLSGGIDSSSVVALMASISGSRIKTFTLAYEDEFKNKEADRAYAKQVADFYHTDHYEHIMTAAELSGTAEAVIRSFDEPFSGVTSTFFLTRLISQHVKVALSGDGADELFASYLPHRLASPIHYYGLFKNRIGSLSPEELNLLAPYENQIPYLKSVWGRGDETDRRMGQYVWDEAAKNELYSEKMSTYARGSDTPSIIRACLAACKTPDPLNRALYLDFHTLLPDQVLAFVDRLSMAHSVEVRPPFLDHRLIEWMGRIPGHLKIKQGRCKHLLKEAVKDLLPDEILNRPKEGFVLPINDWILKSLTAYVEDVLSTSRLAKHGLFREEIIRHILDRHYSGQENQGSKIWNLMMFQIWWEQYFG